jgi:hypothetical protein
VLLKLVVNDEELFLAEFQINKNQFLWVMLSVQSDWTLTPIKNALKYIPEPSCFFFSISRSARSCSSISGADVTDTP